MAELKKTLCNRDCPDACGVVATVEDGKVTRLAGDKAHPITRGFLCYRTSLFLERQYSPERLTTPLLRQGGELRPVSWEAALDFIAEKLSRIKAESGPASILHYRSGGTLGLLASVVDFFFERFGPCATKSGDICSGAGDAAQEADFGKEDSNDLLDLLRARHVILWGKNAHVSSPHTLSLLLEARKQGTRLVMVDPVRHRTADSCETFWQVRPGGDFALAMAVARILFERGWVDAQAAARCDSVDDFKALAFARTVEAGCAEADVPVAAAVDLAERLGPGKPSAILVGWGMARRSGGSATVRALDALGTLSGNLGKPGGGVSYYFGRRTAFDTSFLSQSPPRTIGEIGLGTNIEAAREPPIRAVWITAGNPVVMLPDSHATARALASRELTVVVDSFLTDTARCATVVLPTTTWLEADDLLGAYGHHWLGASRPVVPAPAGVLSDLEIIQAVASRVGLGDALAGTAREWKERLVKGRLLPKGVTLERLEAGVVRNPLAPEVLFEDGAVPTPSKKVRLLSHAPPAELPLEAGYPLRLMALSTEKSQCSQWARPLDGPLEVTVHPASAAGVADGGLAKLESTLASMTVRVRHDARQRKDVLLAPKGGHLVSGHCTNALTRARLTDAGEGGALYEEGVRLVPTAQ